MKEFNLSEKIEDTLNSIFTSNRYWVLDDRTINEDKFKEILDVLEKSINKDVKEFIRLLKEKKKMVLMDALDDDLKEVITLEDLDKLAGDELIWMRKNLH